METQMAAFPKNLPYTSQQSKLVVYKQNSSIPAAERKCLVSTQPWTFPLKPA